MNLLMWFSTQFSHLWLPVGVKFCWFLYLTILKHGLLHFNENLDVLWVNISLTAEAALKKHLDSKMSLLIWGKRKMYTLDYSLNCSFNARRWLFNSLLLRVHVWPNEMLCCRHRPKNPTWISVIYCTVRPFSGTGGQRTALSARWSLPLLCWDRIASLVSCY